MSFQNEPLEPDWQAGEQNMSLLRRQLMSKRAHGPKTKLESLDRK